MGEGLARARADLEHGHLWKARDRLTGLLAADPADQEALALLAETYYLMGDLPTAGCYWFLTEREGEDVAAARAAMSQRHRGSSALLAALPVAAALERYPPAVRERLERLAAEAQEEAPWLRFTPKMRRVTQEEAVGASAGGIPVVALIVAFVLPWLVGLAALGYGLWKLVSLA